MELNDSVVMSVKLVWLMTSISILSVGPGQTKEGLITSIAPCHFLSHDVRQRILILTICYLIATM